MKAHNKNRNYVALTTVCLLLLVSALSALDLAQGQDQRKDIPTAKSSPEKSQDKDKTPTRRKRVPSTAITQIRRGPKLGKLPPQKYYITNDIDFPEGPPPKGMRYGQLGLTIWRARPSRSGDQVKGVFDEAESETTLERTDDTGLIAIGDRLWVSVEPFGGGYLYVVNRELYEDGTMGAARLIFPTTLTANNKARPRRLLVLPRREGNKAFRIRPSESEKTHVGEVLTIILAPHPLERELPLPIADRAMPLSDEFVTGWEQRWGGRMKRSSLAAGESDSLTRKEQTASRPSNKRIEDETESLNQFDALPQLFFKGALESRMPSLVTIVLRFRGDKSQSAVVNN